jgi:hypothetical protein
VPLTIEHVENTNPSLRVYLQQIRLKKKVEQVEEQKLGFKSRSTKVESTANRS